MGKEVNIPIILKENGGIKRIEEPITGGIPIKNGLVFDTDKIYLFDRNKALPIQTKVLARWPDNSIKWLLLDFKASLGANCKKILYLKESGNTLFNKNINLENFYGLVNKIKITACDKEGKNYEAVLSNPYLEDKGGLKTIIKYISKIRNKDKNLLDFIARLSFYHERKAIKLDFTLRNSKAAEHKGGFWDLGDKGSVLFKDMSIRVKLNKGSDIYYKDKIRSKLKKCDDVVVYQDSSGNKNWNSKNHVNRKNKVMNSFKGYKVFCGGKEISKGFHAQPMILAKDSKSGLSVAVKDFWQNFPKAIEANRDEIIIWLFPKQYNDLHELQGGEQKTHTIWFDLSGNDLDWIQSRLVAMSTPEYYSECGVFPYLTPSEKADKRYQKLIDCMIKGKDRFEKKNEIIDEYGWRNFGDVYADHEAVNEKGLISHYNNQYDFINGALLQFLRSGNLRWFKIADNMAKHVGDIDIYHTVNDRSAYNKGMFWHTFHYIGAATSTHRSYSKYGAAKMGEFDYGVGGGPSNEHNYATGLMNHYFLTGENLSKEAVMGLAEWVIDMDEGSKSKLWFLGNKPTGKASRSESIFYHGPGRGSGNSVNVLIDGYEISRNVKYLKKAEQLIRRCIHPRDEISKKGLKDIEHKWFYLIFLQALARYIDLKIILKQLDYMFYYAKDSLLHYANWMIKNEVPYKEVFHKVNIPSETWVAQDIRKSVVFDCAYKYSKDERFKERAQFFFDRCIKDLYCFETKYFTRPLSIIMNYGLIHDFFKDNNSIFHLTKKKYKFRNFKVFKPSGYYLYKIREIIKRK